MKADGHGVRTVTPKELLGPLARLEQKYAPKELYISGRLRLPLLHPRVAIVGTRKPSHEGLRISAMLAKHLSERGVMVVSGLARGIDTAVHTAALEADGTTLAVLGTPLARVHPAENAELQRRLMNDQLAVSQFPRGLPDSPGKLCPPEPDHGAHRGCFRHRGKRRGGRLAPSGLGNAPTGPPAIRPRPRICEARTRVADPDVPIRGDSIPRSR